MNCKTMLKLALEESMKNPTQISGYFKESAEIHVNIFKSGPHHSQKSGPDIYEKM